MERTVPKPSPKTAKELFELVESRLISMPVEQQNLFWLLITENSKNTHYKEMFRVFSESLRHILEGKKEYTNESMKLIVKMAKLVSKHRRPVKNEDRDAEIIKLHEEGKSGGEIVNKLKGRFQLKDNTVRRVISDNRRQNKKTAPPHGS
jgi:CRISPR/Cas system CMR subunit Cmr4 (Cas7 group RAMP superfamily)